MKIAALTPLNLQKEKENFFADFSYNPQFEYHGEFSKTQLTKWGLPDKKFAAIANKLLTLHKIPTSTENKISQDELFDIVTKKLTDYSLETKIQIIFDEVMISRCKVNTSTISFRLPLNFTKQMLERVLRHEIDSHLLRRLNTNSLPEGIQATKAEEQVRRTEEGLAVLNGYLGEEKPYLTRGAINYFAVMTALEHSFSYTFNALLEIGLSKKLAWRTCVRVKRGMTDTSQPGAMTKSITYFEGAFMVWKWLCIENNNPVDLYYGRLSIEDAQGLHRKYQSNLLLLPTYIQDIDKYKTQLQTIADINYFNELL